ncbi:MAG: ABC transporter ATP-binding protein [Pseudomonadota bacterium]
MTPSRDDLLSKSTGAGNFDAEQVRHHHAMTFIWAISWRQQLVIIALALTVAALDVIPLELQRRLVDGAIEEGSIALLIELSLVYLAVIATHAITKHALRVFQGAVAEDVLRNARATLYDKSAADDTQPLNDDHDDNAQDGEGTRVAVLGQEIEQIALFSGVAYGEAVVQLATIVGLIGYMAVTEPLLAAISLPFLLPQAVAVPLIQRRINRLSADRVEERRALNTAVIDEDGRKFHRTGRVLRRLGVNVAWWKSVARLVVNGLNALAPLAVLGFGGALVIQGETTLGVLVAFVSGFQRLSDPAKHLLDHYRAASLTQTRYRLVAAFMARHGATDTSDRKTR